MSIELLCIELPGAALMRESSIVDPADAFYIELEFRRARPLWNSRPLVDYQLFRFGKVWRNFPIRDTFASRHRGQARI
jgi:hypothetical protein